MARNARIADFKQWKFSWPPSYAALPIDENPHYNVPVAVTNAVYSKVPTEPLTGTLHLVCVSEDALENILDLDPKVAETEEFVNFLAGKYLPEGGLSVCHRYGGYQFGFWADQLGDGRAHILGEYINSGGRRWQPQLKGSGETPYSRFGDGRAVLRSSLREMVASEACHHLGIPSTRAAGLVASDEHRVLRDAAYCGRARPERAAVLLRLAPAWYRLGSFEILRRRDEPRLAAKLADFVIEHHFPELAAADDKYARWFAAVARANLDLVAAWQGVGFAHGVLNTDNVSVLGLALDYGPFGFVDHYAEHFSPNSSDDAGRYALRNQPDAMVWNLTKFAEALRPLLSPREEELVRGEVAGLSDYVRDKILETFLRKLGRHRAAEGDAELVRRLLDMMHASAADFGAAFRQLAEAPLERLCDGPRPQSEWALARLAAARDWPDWLRLYEASLRLEDVDDAERRRRMERANPCYVPRNWMLHEAIADAEKNDFDKVRALLRVLRQPYRRQPEAEARGYGAAPPAWALQLKLSCSS